MTPSGIATVYAVMSLTAFGLYGKDKRAARDGHWRTPERTLHIVALLGGWPGALVAQRVFRHKSRKAAFQWVFRSTVVANLAVLAWWWRHG